MLKTVTYNTDTHKVVPLRPNGNQVNAAFISWKNSKFAVIEIYKVMLSAAPEFEGEK